MGDDIWFILALVALAYLNGVFVGYSLGRSAP